VKQILSYCGYRCDLCPAYRGNLKSQEDRLNVAKAWIKYYDHHSEPDEVDCDGCVEGPRAPNPNCKVRPCAIERGVPHCAACEEFGCEKIAKQMAAIRPIAEKYAESMPPEDRKRYIAPYESEQRLRDLRGS
jgi:hypothetical protein